MWEAIASNRFRSRVLITVMGTLLMALGAMIGMSIDPNTGWPIGMAVAFAVWLVMFLVAFYGGDSILLSTAGAHRIEKKECPVLYNVVEEMCLAAGLPTMPEIYITDDKTPNAFAVGRTPEKAAVVVTMGLLSSMFYSSGSRYRSSGKNNGNAQAFIFVSAIVLSILAPIVAQILYFACSRKREYLADASSARFTRYPEGLASALEKIGGSPRDKAKEECKARNLAPLYIVNPLQAAASNSILATHPPIEKRVKILRAMTGASYADYETAYRKNNSDQAHCLSARSVADLTPVAKRDPLPPWQETIDTGTAADPLNPAREVLDHFAMANQFTIIPCACGMRLKLPPDYPQPTMKCPRCGRVHDIPQTGNP